MPRPENSPERHVVVGETPIVTDRGNPYPPSEVVEFLARTKPRWKIEWLDAAWGMSGFVIKEKWHDEDKRWERVRCGECDPENAFDVIIRFPREIRTGEMVSWMENKLGYVKDPAKEADRLIAQAMKLRADAEQQAVERAVETGTQRVLDESDHTRLVRAGVERAAPMVSGHDFVEREPKRLLVTTP